MPADGIVGNLTDPSLLATDHVYSYTASDTAVIDEAAGSYVSYTGTTNTFAFNDGTDHMTFFGVSAAQATYESGAAVGGGSGDLTLGIDGKTLVFSGSTASLNGNAIDFANGSKLITNNGNAAILKGSSTAVTNDLLIAGANGDTLYGYAGNDVLIGGAGADTIFGGTGADTILGNGGNDYLLGGLGNDIFKYTATASNGNDVIADWNVGDSIHITDKKQSDIVGAYTIAESGLDTLITSSNNGDTIRVIGTHSVSIIGDLPA